MVTTYNFNFNSKEDMTKQFRTLPLETLKEYQTLFREIDSALSDVIEVKEEEHYNELRLKVLDLLEEMKQIRPYKNYYGNESSDLILSIDEIIDLF